ncbi:MAG: DUF711 family protein [Chloroflexota bacterium]
MKIRAITLGLDARWPDPASDVADAAYFARAAADRFEAAGYEVQTVRLAYSPLAERIPDGDPGLLRQAAREIDAAASDAGVPFVSIGPVRWSHLGAAAAPLAAAVPDVIAATSNISASIETAAGGRLIGPAAEAAGAAIAALAARTADGFGNFRFGAIAQCPGGIPFFPAAYHGGGQQSFALGLQAADLARLAYATPGSLDDVAASLLDRLAPPLNEIDSIAESLATEHGIAYGGADLTPAPFPTDDESSAGILEDIGVDAVGAAGSLSAAAIMTRLLKDLPFKKVGFSGLMLPVLEDSVLAARSRQGLLTWPELLLWSAVCGTGLDTVPLPGDTSAAELAGIALDVATLAVAMNKPLTCRLLPVPGKRAGEITEYDFPYFSNARILDVSGHGAGRLFDRLRGPA